ncbi:hypothetical protein H8959_015055 [Pygathrix nigripes]
MAVARGTLDHLTCLPCFLITSHPRKHHERHRYQETTVYPSFMHIFNYPKCLHSITLLGELLNIGNTLDMVVYLFWFCNCCQSSTIFSSETKYIL